MSNTPLPAFKARHYDRVVAYITEVLKLDNAKDSHFRDLITYEDGHYRVLFDYAYFFVHDDRTEPSKSQWNTLKKRMKRHDKAVFVFKEHGQVMIEGVKHCYLDFGFFAD